MSSAVRLRSPIRRPRERVNSGIRLGPRTIKMIAKIIMSSGKPILNILDIISKINYSDNTNPLSIYIHIPFCRSKCIYCDFNSIPVEPFSEYFKAIIEDIELLGRIVKNREVISIYIGGGTPSIVPEEFIVMILNKIKSTFKLNKNCELTIEVNPESLSLSRAKSYKKSGINRVSVGIQSFKEKYLKALGRAGNVSHNINAFKILRSAEFINISADLMYGLPLQNITDWLEDLKNLIEYEPVHISAYMLTPPPHSKSDYLPAEDKCIEMLHKCIEILEENGFKQYEISNFSLPKHECIHNLNYWNWGEYIGLGAGAHSFLKSRNETESQGIRWWNKSSPREFSNTNAETRVAGFEFIDTEKALEELIMLGLRKRDGIKVSQIEKFVKIDWNNLKTRIKKLIDKDLVNFDGDILKLTKSGIAVANSVTAEVLHVINV